MSRVLIAGHSQAKYFDQYTQDRTVQVMSYSGFRIDEMWPKIQGEISKHEIIVIHVGANDLWNGTVDSMMDAFLKLLCEIKVENVGAEIVVSGLLPRAQSRIWEGKRYSFSFLDHVNDLASDVNQHLKGLCEEHQHLHLKPL